MKKFLAILLIALIVCETVEEEIDMNSLFKKIWKKIKNGFKKAWNWLKKKGILKIIWKVLKTAGKAAATALCSKFVEDASKCDTIISAL